MNDSVIKFENVGKTFSGKRVLDRVTFSVERGSICGLLGSNGSGKSTSLKILMDLVRPTEGKAIVLGLNANEPSQSLEVRRRVAYVTEDKSFYPFMNARQLMDYVKSFHPAWNKDLEKKILRDFEIDAAESLKHFSKGNRAKLALILALCRAPEILILDEPTEGLDPLGREEFLQALIRASSDGVTVLLSTHLLSDMERIIDSVVLLEKGNILLQDEVERLKENSRFYHFTFRDQAPASLSNLPSKGRFARQERSIVVSSVGEKWNWKTSLEDLQVESFEERAMTLSDIYTELLRGHKNKREVHAKLD